MDSSKILEQFVDLFHKLKSESEQEVFKLCRLFTEKTGGHMSPYRSPTPVAVAVVKIRANDGTLKFLGIRRGIAPKIGEIAFPGGFVNYMESCELAAFRELEEECPGIRGISAEDFEMLATKITPTNNLLMFMVSKSEYPESILDPLVPNEEALEFCLITRETPMAFPLHAEIRDLLYTKN